MIQMEHPQLPKTPSDPPTQLWLTKLDAQVRLFLSSRCLSGFNTLINLFLSFRLTEQGLLESHCNGKHIVFTACAASRWIACRRDGSVGM